MALAIARAMPSYKTDLRARARRFAVDAYRLSRHVRQTCPALRNHADQLADAAASIGANLAESKGFNTRREMAARYAVALKESREAAYWLEVIADCEPALAVHTAPLLAECKEFIAHDQRRIEEIALLASLVFRSSFFLRSSVFGLRS